MPACIKVPICLGGVFISYRTQRCVSLSTRDTDESDESENVHSLKVKVWTSFVFQEVELITFWSLKCHIIKLTLSKHAWCHSFIAKFLATHKHEHKHTHFRSIIHALFYSPPGLGKYLLNVLLSSPANNVLSC